MDLDAELLAVEHALQHCFRNRALLRDALTHSSFAHEKPKLAPRDNERLEFLGDAVLGLLVSHILWKRYPEACEGELTQRRADLVCGASLARQAQRLGLGAALRLGKGEARSGGRQKSRLLAGCLEACVGAVFLDGGMPATEALVQRLFADDFGASEVGMADSKSRLQEVLHQRGIRTPTYHVQACTGFEHARIHHVEVSAGAYPPVSGTGVSRLAAEQAAAAAALALWFVETPLITPLLEQQTMLDCG
ncbi:MAG: ribonuclease III [Polyangiales bacterium]